MDSELSGRVIRGREYEDKVPTANVLMDSTVSSGTYVGTAYDGGGVLLGKSFVFISDYAPDIAEVYITDYDGDLIGEKISVEFLTKLDRDDMKRLYDMAMMEWEKGYYVPEIS